MGNSAAIIATLELDRGKFKTNKEETERDIKKLGEVSKETAAAVAILERQLASDKGNAALKSNLSTLKATLRETGREMKLLESQKKALDEAMGKGGGHGNQGQMAHSGRAVLEMMMAGQSPLQALQVEAPRIIQAKGGGLGTMLGIGAGIAAANKLVEGISEGISKARELGNTLREAMRPGPSQGTEGIESMKKRIEGLDQAVDASRPKLGLFERFGQRVTDAVGRSVNQLSLLGTGQFREYWKHTGSAAANKDGDSSKNEALRNQALKERADLNRKINEEMGQENSLRERATDHGATSAKMDELRLQKAHDLAAAEEELGIPKMRGEIERIQADPTATPAMKAKRIAEINKSQLNPAQDALKGRSAEIERDYANREKLVEREQAQLAASVRLQDALNTAKERGVAVDLEGARAKFSDAVATLKNGPKDGLEHDANYEKARAAQEELILAGRAHAIREESFGIEKEIADFRGGADAKHLFSLEKERQFLEYRRKLAKPEEQEQIDVQLAQNRSQKYDAERASVAASDQAYLAQKAAGYGRGTESQRRKLQDRRDVLGFEMDANTAGTNEAGERVWKDGHKGAQQMEEDNQLKLAIEELTGAMKEHVQALKVQGTQIQNKGFTPTLGMKDEATNAKYDQQASAERLGGNNEEALAQIEKNRQAELAGNQADEYMLTPAERAERQRRNAARQRALDRATGKTGTPEAAANDTDGAFNARFHPHRVQPDRRGKANVDPQTKAGDGKGGDADKIVKAINRPEWAKDLSFKNQ